MPSLPCPIPPSSLSCRFQFSSMSIYGFCYFNSWVCQGLCIEFTLNPLLSLRRQFPNMSSPHKNAKLMPMEKCWNILFQGVIGQYGTYDERVVLGMRGCPVVIDSSGGRPSLRIRLIDLWSTECVMPSICVTWSDNLFGFFLFLLHRWNWKGLSKDISKCVCYVYAGAVLRLKIYNGYKN